MSCRCRPLASDPETFPDQHSRRPAARPSAGRLVKSVKARIRTTFATVPDAPLSKFTLNLKSGKKGLLVNNRNICAHEYRVGVKLTAQNGKLSDTNPVMGTSCKKGSKGK